MQAPPHITCTHPGVVSVLVADTFCSPLPRDSPGRRVRPWMRQPKPAICQTEIIAMVPLVSHCLKREEVVTKSKISAVSAKWKIIFRRRRKGLNICVQCTSDIIKGHHGPGTSVPYIRLSLISEVPNRR